MKVEEINDYVDPENVDEILEKIKSCATIKEIDNLIKETFFNWIVEFLDRYSYDYPHLQTNWEIITKQFNIKHAKIMIVDKTVNDNDEKYSLIRVFSEIFTQSGFIVRSKDELFSCKICGGAIPNEETYNKIKETGLSLIPEKWDTKCIDCKL